MLGRLFCYGTLRVPAVVRALLGRVPGSRDAVLPAYRRGRLAGRPWPGIAPSAAESVGGTLYEGLTAAELRRLDRYEGADYRRGAVHVQTRAGRQRTWAYLPRRPLADDPDAAATPWRVLGLPPPRPTRPASKSRPL